MDSVVLVQPGDSMESHKCLTNEVAIEKDPENETVFSISNFPDERAPVFTKTDTIDAKTYLKKVSGDTFTDMKDVTQEKKDILTDTRLNKKEVERKL